MRVQFLHTKRGISPVISVILVVTLTVALVSILTFIVFDINKDVKETPSATITYSDSSVTLIRLGNTDSVIIREGGKDDIKLNIGQKYNIDTKYEYEIIGLIDDSEVLLKKGAGESISTRNNKEATNIDKVYNNLDGDGTEENPYIITNDQELQAMEKDITGHYKLGNNIDASGTGNWYDGKGFKPIPEFNGELNGEGYEIVGLTINRPTESNIGLISESEAILNNIGMIDSDIVGDENVGSIIGRNSNHVTINNSYSLGNVEGNNNVGGVIGLNHNHAEIRESHAIYDVEGNNNVGGLIGKNNNHANIYSSYSSGNITGIEYVGGLVGNNNNHGNIYTSYSRSQISGEENVGGLIGNLQGNIEDSYWDEEKTGLNQRDPMEGEGLRTSEMTGENAKENMDGFDFDNVWFIESDEYPQLRNIND